MGTHPIFESDFDCLTELEIMPPKKGKKSAEEEEKARLEEEERLRVEREEDEKRAKAQARIERIESLRQSLKETRHDNENRLVGSFNNYLLAKSDLIESRKSNETWDRWLDQSGRPELLSAKSIASFVTRCTESEATESSILDEYELANQLIGDIKKLSMDYPDRTTHFSAAIDELNLMKEQRLDQLTLEFLKTPGQYIDDRSDDLMHEFYDEKAKLRYMVWANTSKNTRRRKVEFDQNGALIRVELTKQQCTDDAGVRIYYTDDDTHAVTMPEQLDPTPLEPPREEVQIDDDDNEATDENGAQDNDIDQIASGEVLEKVASAKSVKSQATKTNVEPVAASLADTKNGQLDNVDDFDEENHKPERIGLDGKDGIGGVWHIDFLAAPEAPKKQGGWTIKRQYSDELAKVPLKADHQPNKTVELVLPKPVNAPANVPLSLGVWNKHERRWECGAINISEEKDGSVYFTSDVIGDFKFFIDRHQNDGDKPLVETWLMRPNGADVELFLILQNYKLLFTIHPNGTVSLTEQHEPKMLKEEKNELLLEELLLALEDESLFVFPTDASLQYLDFIDKNDYVIGRAIQNMCACAHQLELKMSPFNGALDNERLALLANNNSNTGDIESTILCDDEKFYIIEDKYIPPEPPQAPSATSVEDTEADEAFQAEIEKYEAKIAADEEAFEPDFDMPRNGETMEATLDACLKCESTITEQNLTVYKLLAKSKVFNF